jgi:hypothetical protein
MAGRARSRTCVLREVTASLTHRRSDSVVVPMVAATCTRLIAEATSTSACCFCVSPNLRPCGATSERAGRCRPPGLGDLPRDLLLLDHDRLASGAAGQRRSIPPQLTLILCGITGPVSGKKPGVTTSSHDGGSLPRPSVDRYVG